jgi:spore maturation protein SpmB
MCLFLAINTSGLSILPTGTINMRAMSGSTDPACIWLPTLLATVFSTTVAIVSAKLLMRLGCYQLPAQPSGTPVKTEPVARTSGSEDLSANGNGQRAGWVTLLIVWSCAAGFVAAAGWYFFRKAGEVNGFGLTKEFFSYWALPALMGGLLLFGLARNVRVYESLVEGAKEGFQVTVRIIPYLVALFVAVGMFTASGAMDLLKGNVGQVTNMIGLPVELLPLAIIRPLSGSGSFSYMTSLFNQYGPDSFIGQMASVMQGSMDTTLYILAVYFGSVQVRKVRYALAAGLLADLGGIIAAVALSHLFFQ